MDGLAGDVHEELDDLAVAPPGIALEILYRIAAERGDEHVDLVPVPAVSAEEARHERID